MTTDDRLFQVMEIDGEPVFGSTQTTTTNIHSHYTGAGSEDWHDYQFSGRMRISGQNDGIGVTFYSDYPFSDRYYRLRRYGNQSFHIAPHGAGIECTGATDTAVVPAVDTWYEFLIDVENGATETQVRAKVWQSGSSEPADWQASCVDGGTRLTAGTVGLWGVVSGKDSGAKYWDDLTLAGPN
jgi:hypothetical protein